MRMHNPPHPGEVLREYLGGSTVTASASKWGVSRQWLSAILNGRADLSPAMALRLSDVLGTSPDMWMALQFQYDMRKADASRRGREPD